MTLCHYRTIALKGEKFTLSDLESFCATLRAHDITGEETIYSSYEIVLSVKVTEPLLTPIQLKAI